MEIRGNPTDIRCILFDLGQTIFSYHGLLVNMRLATLCGAKDPEEVRLCLIGRKKRCPNPRLSVYRASVGRINDTEFIEEIRAALCIDSWIPESRIENSLLNSTDLSGRMRKLLYFLGDERQDGRFIMGIISNIPRIQWEELLLKYRVLRLRKDDLVKDRKGGDKQGMMDTHTLSFEERLMKPNRRIFRRGFRRVRMLARAHGIELKPRHCLYFDDIEENVVAARAVGMKSILVTGPRDKEWGSQDSYESIVQGLQACGIKLPPCGYRPFCDTPFSQERFLKSSITIPASHVLFESEERSSA